MRDTKTAIELMEKAWTARRETMMSPPSVEGATAKGDGRCAQGPCRGGGNMLRNRSTTRIGACLDEASDVEQDMGHDDATQSLYEKAVAVSRAHGDELLLAHSVRHLGDIQRNAGHVAVAEECYDEALALYRKHDQPPKLDFANAIRPMAILKEESGNVEQAVQLWQEARELYDDVNVQAVSKNARSTWMN